MERFGCRTHFAHLRQVQRIADTVSDIRRKRPDVRPGIGKPREFFHPALHAYIGILRRSGSTRYNKIRKVYIFPAVAADSLGATARIPYSPGPSGVGGTIRNWPSPTFSTPNAIAPLAKPLFLFTGPTLNSRAFFAAFIGIDYPRIHHQGTPGRIDAEPAALVTEVAARLKAMGHKINPALRSQGDVHAVAVEPKTNMRLGWSDGRRGGKAVGY